MNTDRQAVWHSPIVRMSLAMALLTSGLLMMTEFLGLFPDETRVRLEARKTVAETLAIQTVAAVQKGTMPAVNAVFESMLDRRSGIRSIGLRQMDGELIIAAGAHRQLWRDSGTRTSNETHVKVPIYHLRRQWGTLELVFEPLPEGIGDFQSVPPLLMIVLFVGVASFIGYIAFLRRALAELDPNAVIPQRVRAAFDALSEGLIIVDADGRIVLANSAFETRLDRSAASLTGQSLSALGWKSRRDEDAPPLLPWLSCLAGIDSNDPVELAIEATDGRTISFAVTALAIRAPDGSVRGAMVSFNDQTDIEKANGELKHTLTTLESMQRELARQNQELLVLATRDPLTGVLNRRALFEAFENLINREMPPGRGLCCIMVDIDKFKSINDRYGHGVGDVVIKSVAGVLTAAARATDLVGRYGGEEFCILLPDTRLEEAREVAERIRLAIQQGAGKDSSLPLQVTASLGVSGTESGSMLPVELCNEADRALYLAKESGRNQVRTWQEARVYASTNERAARSAVAAGKAAEKAVEPAAHRQDDAVRVQLEQRVGDLEQALQDSERERAKLLLGDPADAAQDRDRAFTAGIAYALGRVSRSHSSGALLAIEIATIDSVDTALGTGSSSKLRDAVRERIGQVIRTTDAMTAAAPLQCSVLGQKGDHEILLLLTDMKDAVDASRVVERIETNFREMMSIDGLEIFISLRFGIAVFPADGSDEITLRSRAYAALRECRARPGALPYRYYSTGLNQAAFERLRLESELRHAIDKQELLLHYQPRADIASGRICALEALVRWQHPRHGLIYPDRFIPLAEETGLIVDLGRWVVSTVCRQMRQWQAEGMRKLEVAINVSPIELNDAAFPRTLQSLVGAEGINPAQIELEITESVVIANIDTVFTLLKELGDAGFNVALDDFGTGYASMSYLRQLPLSRIKIDRSFLAGLDTDSTDHAIVYSLVELGHILGKRVVAEGVESQAQWDTLRELGCDEAQGYFLSAPVDTVAIRSLLTAGSPLDRKLRLVHGSRLQYEGDATRSVIKGVLNESRHPARQLGSSRTR